MSGEESKRSVPVSSQLMDLHEKALRILCETRRFLEEDLPRLAEIAPETSKWATRHSTPEGVREVLSVFRGIEGGVSEARARNFKDEQYKKRF
ncbi:hypothetical protein ACFL2D_00010 [Patescibacteria group bacterium]